jgi:hypothetical protein
MIKDEKLEKIILKVKQLFSEKKFNDGLNLIESALDPLLVPLSYQDKIIELKRYAINMLDEETARRCDDLKTITRLTFNTNNIDDIYLDKFIDMLTNTNKYDDLKTSKKQEIIDMVESFTLSKTASNRRKKFLFNILQSYGIGFNLSFYNNMIKQEVKMHDRTYYEELLTFINSKLLNQPSLLENALSIIEDIEIFYFGTIPPIDSEKLAETIIDFLNNGYKNNKAMNIILHSISNEPFTD